MISGIDPGRARRRLAVAAAILAGHLLFVVLLARLRPPARPGPVAAVITVVSLPAPAVRPAVQRDLPLGTPMAIPAFEVAVPTVPAVVPCDVPAMLGAVLHADPTVAAALAPVAATPQPAIMAWNGRWSDRPETAPVHRTIAAVLKATRPDCLDEDLAGPRLVFIAVDGTTVSVAVGSGRWRWRDLLSSDQ